MIRKLLDRLNKPFDQDPEAFLAIRASHVSGVAWSIKDDCLTLMPSGQSAPIVVDLSAYTVGGLVQVLSAQDGLTVTASGNAALDARVLIDASGSAAPGATFDLNGYGSLLWAIMAAFAGELRQARQAISDALAQMNIRSAEGYWLKLWGARFGVPPLTGESDPSYSARLPAEVVRSKVNNVAIEMALEAYIGQPATVTDVTTYQNTPYRHDGVVPRDGSITRNAPDVIELYGLFDVAYSYDLLSGGDISAFEGVVRGLVDRLRAAGTHLRALQLNGSLLSDVVPLVSDATSGNLPLQGQVGLADVVATPVDVVAPLSAEVALEDAPAAPSDPGALSYRLTVLHNGARNRDGSFPRCSGYVVTETLEGVAVTVSADSLSLILSDPSASGLTHFMGLG